MTAFPKLGAIWVYLAASPLLGLTITLVAYLFAQAVYARARFNPLANPVLIAVAVIVVLLPHFIIGAALDSGALVPVLDAYVPPPITLNAVFPQHREGFVTLRTFIGFLAERLAEPAPTGASGAGRVR